MKSDPPAATRERLTAKEFWGEFFGTHADYADPTICKFAEAYRQAAQPSSEKIEAVARRIAAGRGRREWPFSEEEIAAILREELGGK